MTVSLVLLLSLLVWQASRALLEQESKYQLVQHHFFKMRSNEHYRGPGPPWEGGHFNIRSTKVNLTRLGCKTCNHGKKCNMINRLNRLNQVNHCQKPCDPEDKHDLEQGKDPEVPQTLSRDTDIDRGAKETWLKSSQFSERNFAGFPTCGTPKNRDIMNTQGANDQGSNTADQSKQAKAFILACNDPRYPDEVINMMDSQTLIRVATELYRAKTR